MKLYRLLTLLLVFNFCFSQNHNNQLDKLDKAKIKEPVIDIIEYFSKEELPFLYTIATIHYQCYFLKDRLAKIILIYDGDRETLKESYYFDSLSEVFYIKQVYSFYNPPKWDENSKLDSVEESCYYIKQNKVFKAVGKNTENSNKIIQRLTRLKEVIEIVNDSISTSSK